MSRPAPASILVIVHQTTSDPGLVGSHLQTLGYRLDRRVPNNGDALPDNLEDYAGTVVFGGPMSANDEHLPGIRAELDWIPTAIASEKPFLGICLGAQLLTRVLGGRVSPHADGLTEIGYYPIQATAEGRSLLGDLSHVYHWHREGFEAPTGAVPLATGARFPQQAYRYDNAYALQFHPEMNWEIMARWLTEGRDQLTQPGAQPGYLHRRGHRQHSERIRRWLHGFLPLWLAAKPR